MDLDWDEDFTSAPSRDSVAARPSRQTSRTKFSSESRAKRNPINSSSGRASVHVPSTAFRTPLVRRFEEPSRFQVVHKPQSATTNNAVPPLRSSTVPVRLFSMPESATARVNNWRDRHATSSATQRAAPGPNSHRLHTAVFHPRIEKPESTNNDIVTRMSALSFSPDKTFETHAVGNTQPPVADSPVDDSENSERDEASSAEKESIARVKSCRPGQLTGRVVGVVNQTCFIQPDDELPEGYPDKNVTLPLRNAQIPLNCFSLAKGDVVQFVLGTHEKAKCLAIFGRVIYFVPRKQDDIGRVLQRLLERLEDVEVLMFLNTNAAFWTLSGESVTDTADVGLLVSLQSKLAKFTEYKESFKECIQALYATRFADREGPLVRFVCQTFRRGGEETIQLQEYLLFLIKLDKTLVHKVIYILENALAASQADPCALWMLKIVKSVAKYSTDALDVDFMEWNTLPLIPTTREVLAIDSFDPSKLNGVRLENGYRDSYEYLDTYFRLLRAECFSQISLGIREFLKGELDLRNMNVYIRLKLKAFYVDKMAGALVMVLSMTPCDQKRRIKSNRSLMSGNLLCISPSGKFDDPLWAIVRNRINDSRDLEIAIEPILEMNGDNLFNTIKALMTNGQSSVLAESPSYYPSIGPVLRTLQLDHFSTVPFEEEIVHTQFKRIPPEYVPNNVIARYESLPKEQLQIKMGSVTLDKYQSQAFLHAMENRLALIQGPPGTGKTFIGKMIVEHILENYPDVAPILILTYKNHALDEFLKGVVEFLGIEKVARIGGRGDKDLEACNLSELRNEKRDQAIFSAMRELMGERDDIVRQVMELLKDLNESAFLSAEDLHKHLTDDELRNFLRQIPWRKKDLPLEELKESHKMVDDFLDNFSRSPEVLTVELTNVFRALFRYWAPSAREIAASQAPYSKRLETLVNKLNHRKPNPAREGELEDLDDEDQAEENEERIKLLGKQKIDDRLLVKLSEFASDFSLNNFNWQSLGEQFDFFDVWSYSKDQKINLIGSLLSRGVDQCLSKLKLLLDALNEVRKKLKQFNRAHEASVLKKRKVVAMTITGASIHQDLILNLKPSVVLVEEAAEILESSLIAAIGPSVKHLILIGDHKQLRPNVETFSLRKHCRFDVSMFERLIRRSIPCVSLQVQNRMRPEMAELLRDIYPALQSSSRVKDNAIPKCLEHSISFWDHSAPENKERSVTNEEEAERIVGIVQFLLSQGVPATEITVLAMYLGQASLIRKKILGKRDEIPGLYPAADPEKPSSCPIIVSTVDNYQGDENSVVIVSLVRSNGEGRLGFVDTLNRRCVAQSRAKCATIYVGNAAMVRGSAHWRNLIHQLDNFGVVRRQFKIRCQFHAGSEIVAHSSLDLRSLDFCRVVCHRLMPCQEHRCKKLCQPIHAHDRCREKVLFTFPDCNHQSVKECHQNIEDLLCKQRIVYVFPKCGHKTETECSTKKDSLQCNEEITYTFPNCRHQIRVACHINKNILQCNELVIHTFPRCGHSTHVTCYRDSPTLSCKKLCPRKLQPCGHFCSKLCGEECAPSSCETCKALEAERQKQRLKAEQEARKLLIQKAKDEIEALQKFLKENPKTGVARSDLSQKDEDAAEYLSVKDRVMKYIQTDHKWYPEITRIEKVTNPWLKLKWLEAKTNMSRPDYSDLKFHGTSKEAVEGIIKEGFRLPTKPGMYGAGVYFATDSSKSAQEIYTKGSNMLLLCDVLLGRPKTVDKPVNMNEDQLKLERCDSLFAPRDTKSTGGVLFDEFVVYDPFKALPVYIIHYERRNAQSIPKLPTPVSSFERVILQPKRLVDPNDPYDVLYRIAESQYYRLMNARRPSGNHPAQWHPITASSAYTLEKIEYVRNAALELKFRSMENRFAVQQRPTERVLAFHGTSTDQNIDSIVKDGFNKDKIARCAYGFGIYFSEDPNVSFGYMQNKKLLLCYVLPGRTYTAHLGNNERIPPLYNSKGANPDAQGRFQILVIDNMDQILPAFILHLK